MPPCTGVGHSGQARSRGERLRLTRGAIFPVVLVTAVVLPGVAWGEGILEGISGDVETQYSLFSSKTTDASGTTTKTRINNFINTGNLNLNYDLLPTLNLNTGLSYESNISDPVGSEAGPQTELTRLRPYVWLTLRDTTYNGAVGYNLQRQSVNTSGLPGVTLNQESYNANLNWRPTGLPWTQLRYTRTNTYDDDRSILNRVEDFLWVKPEYINGGLDVYYAGTYLNTDDKILNFTSTQWSNEGRLAYSQNYLDGQISLTTDNRVRYTEIETTTAGRGQVNLPAIPIQGLSSAPNDTPLNGILASNPALIDGNQTVSIGGDGNLVVGSAPLSARNVGLDFSSVVELNSLRVWVTVTDASGTVVDLPQNIAAMFSWDIYTSTDNLNWRFHATVAPAPFGPFLTRFEVNFPSVQTRYIKVVTRPLLSTSLSTTNVRQISITELEAFLNTPAPDIKGRTTQLFQNYNLDVKTILLRSPSLYYDFNGYYFQFDPSGQERYNISNGLFFNHQLTPILSTRANASVEFGTEGDEFRTAVLYYASLNATPLKTLTNSLVFSGNNQVVGGLANRNNSVILYNTAQLYRGVDLILNLGAVYSSQEQDIGGSVDRRDLYVNVGTGITPNPKFTISVYYLGKLSHVSGGNGRGPQDTTENRVDLAASYSPFTTLFLSAVISALAESGQQTQVQQSYGLTWSPFPDGNLQFTFYYNDNYFPDHSRTIQPTLRWYLGAKRRSYLESSYQYLNSDSGGLKTESNIFTTTLRIFF